MTHKEFNQPSFKHQRTRAYLRGRYLATRWQETGEAVRLFLMPEGLFVELTFTPTVHGAQHLFAFQAGSEDDRLLDYALFVQLPEWMPAAE